MTEPTPEERIPLRSFTPETLPLADAFAFGERGDAAPGVARPLPPGTVDRWLRESIGIDLRPAEAAELATIIAARHPHEPDSADEGAPA
jgi:hypothetical protein